jgi:hypothetical protein
VCQCSFQSKDLLAEDQLAGGHGIRHLKSIPPDVNNPRVILIPRQFDYVAAAVHSFNGLLFEFGAVPFPLRRSNCGSFPAKCATSFCLALGVHSKSGKISVSEFSRTCKCFRMKESPNCGRVAQLGEHLLCKQGVAGSIPATSTIFSMVQPGHIGDTTYLRHG